MTRSHIVLVPAILEQTDWDTVEGWAALDNLDQWIPDGQKYPADQSCCYRILASGTDKDEVLVQARKAQERF